MCDQTEIDYLDGDIVWVKLGSCWWPGEVVGTDRLPPDVLPSFRKPPIAVVKFFQETTYEYVKTISSIYKYNCSRKNEFIIKGLDMYRTKPHMEKFPEDVIRAETAVGGDKEILTRDEFQEKKKESYAGLFGDKATKTPVSVKKGKGGRGRPPSESPKLFTPIRKFYKEKSDYKVHILLQGAKEAQRQSTDSASTPSTSRAESEPVEEKPEAPQKPAAEKVTFTTPTVSSAGIYSCPSCSFSTSRLNVLILHNKSHSASFSPYTPSPVRKKPAAKSPTKSTPKTSKPKTPRPRKEKPDKPKRPPKKRPAEDSSNYAEVKKPKTDQEIKSSLLADWDDDVDDDSNDEPSTIIMSGDPEFAVGAESPAVPTSAELPSAEVPVESSSPEKKSDEPSTADKPESSSDSKYEFCEEEEWHVEADAGRKIPRVKNRKEEAKSISIDEDDMAKEVAELLTKTVVPELPSIPEPLKAEENFPEPPVVKSPDKTADLSSDLKSSENISEIKPKKAIFKTKTFFRSRHSRSQDAIGKYVAEQLNAAERMDLSENDLNGSEAVSSPEARESPPIEPVKIARLAPKIQLKKMKAEAAQLREKEKFGFDQPRDDLMYFKVTEAKSDSTTTEKYNFDQEQDNTDKLQKSQTLQDVLYPTQEIKPINKEPIDKLHHKEEKLVHKEDLHKDADKVFNNEIFVTTNEIDGENDMELHVIPTTTYGSKSYKKVSTSKSSESNQEETIVQFSAPDGFNETNIQISHADSSSIMNINESTVQEPLVQTVEVSSPNIPPVDELQHEIKLQEASEQSIKIEPKNDENIHKTNPHKSPKVLDQLNEVSSSLVITPEKNIEERFGITSPKKYGSKKVNDQLNEITSATIKCNVQNSYEHPIEPYMNESTASAVDALLSVSRETDRVPRIVTDDPPEDLFEDDKDGSINNEVDSINTDFSTEKGNYEDHEMEPEKSRTEDDVSGLNVVINQEISQNDVNSITLPEDNSVSMSKADNTDDNVITETVVESIPSESDLQIAETLLNLPSTAVQNNVSVEAQENVNMPKFIPMCAVASDEIEEEIIPIAANVVEENNIVYEAKENHTLNNALPSESAVLSSSDLNVRYETEQEKSENLTAAQSLVQMSESIDHKINVENNEGNKNDLLKVDAFKIKKNNGIDSNNTVEQKVALPSKENNNDSANGKSHNYETTSSSLVMMLEEPSTLKTHLNKPTPMKHVIVTGKEKILNLDVAKSPLKAKPQSPKQKIIIRRALSNKTLINKLSDQLITSPDQIILSRNKPAQDGSSIQTFTIKTSSESLTSTDAKQFIIHPKIITPSESQTSTDAKQFIIQPKIKTSLESHTSTDAKQFIIQPKIKTTSLEGHTSTDAKQFIIQPKIKTSLEGHTSTDAKQFIIQSKIKTPSEIHTPTDAKQFIIQPKMKTPSESHTPTDAKQFIIQPKLKTPSESHTPTDAKQFIIQPKIKTPSESHTPTDTKKFIIQPKIRKVTKPKFQKIKAHNSLIIKESKEVNDTASPEEPMFDINSMPVVLSDDILTAESIEKMPIVMSDGNIITNTNTGPSPPKLIKTKPVMIENKNEKVAISALPVHNKPVPNKPEVKTLLMNTANEVNKVTTPNILSKSSKLRGGKPMLVIDKATGKQKIIMTKGEPPAVKEIKPAPTLIQTVPQPVPKTEKFIILPTGSSPRPGRTQKIVIDPQTGKAHVLVAKGQDTPISVPDNKPVSAKLIPSTSDANTPGNTVMIITNAQGAQSRIVLTPEHEKILFPNKQQPNVSQLKTITHRLSTSTGLVQKTIVTTAPPIKTQTKIVPKQKSAVITSKGQLIVGGRITNTAQNIAPMPEIRPAPKRIVASEPKKLVQAIQKNATEPLIFLQQRSGTVMQLTAAQFEHLQRTGQIVQKTPAPVSDNNVVGQKSATLPSKETVVPTTIAQKQRVRKAATETVTHAKKLKQEMTLAPAPPPAPALALVAPPMPPLTSLSSPMQTPLPPAPIVSMSNIVPSVSNTVSVATTPSYPDLENFEELLPSTAIARQGEPTLVPVPRPPEPQPVALPPEPSMPEQVEAQQSQIDGQLLAVPGENFGGPPGSFYLCLEDSGTLTPIDNRPLVLENNQLVPMAIEPYPVFCPQPERRDILEAALANSDVFHAETPRDEAPDFRDLNANVSVHCRVSETSTTLNQPIMTPVEVPSKGDSEPVVPTNMEDGLAVIGVTSHSVPTSLELPITVTDPRIAPKTTDPLSNSNYGPSLLASPGAEMTYVSTEESVGGISMPLLTDEEVGGGKSMPILTDETAERACSSAGGSPASPFARDEAPDETAWPRRLLTPGSDTSDASAEIPLQPAIQLSVNELTRHG